MNDRPEKTFAHHFLYLTRFSCSPIPLDSNSFPPYHNMFASKRLGKVSPPNRLSQPSPLKADMWHLGAHEGVNGAHGCSSSPLSNSHFVVQIQQSLPPGIDFVTAPDFKEWQMDIRVLDSNPLYQDQTYRLRFRFSSNYPIGRPIITVFDRDYPSPAPRQDKHWLTHLNRSARGYLHNHHHALPHNTNSPTYLLQRHYLSGSARDPRLVTRSEC